MPVSRTSGPRLVPESPLTGGIILTPEGHRPAKRSRRTGQSEGRLDDAFPQPIPARVADRNWSRSASPAGWMMRSRFRALAERLRAASPWGGRYVVAGSADDLAVGEIRRVRGLPAVICRTTLQLYAVAVTCPHAGANLSKGRLVGDCIECPLHGARFVLGGNAAVDGQPSLRLRGYDVKVRDGVIYVSRRPRHQVYRGWEEADPREVAGPASRSADGQAPMDGE